MNTEPSPPAQPCSVLARLRGAIPTRTNVEFSEALRLAELHANQLLEFHQVTSGPISNELITNLPKIVVEYVNAPVSGASFWSPSKKHWVIQLNRSEPWARKRFTLAHEYKHIIDHGHTDRLYTGTTRTSPAEQRERAADYFAGCLLVPRRLLKRAIANGRQSIPELARYFQVSEQAMAVRLSQTGLVQGPTHLGPTTAEVDAVGVSDE